MPDARKTPSAADFADAFDTIKSLVAEIETLTDGISKQAETGRALVGAAIAENILFWVVKSSMRPLSKTRTDNLFGGYGPLSSFSAKIAIAHAFKLIDDDVRRDLNIIREIRNAFAHIDTFHRFDSDRIGRLCQKFR